MADPKVGIQITANDKTRAAFKTGTNAPLHNALIGEEYGISSSQVMTQKVYHSRKHPSRVLLPMLKKGDAQ